MGIKLSAEDKIGMSPEEITALEADNADTLLATHGGNENDADGTDETDETQGDSTAATGEEGGEGLTAEQLEAVVDDTTQQPTPAPQPFQVEAVDFAAERKKLTDEKAAIERRWTAGEEGCTDEWRLAELQRIDDARDDLLIRQTRAATLREQNEQIEARRKADYDGAVQSATDALLEASKKQGAAVNYATDTKAQKQFDNALTMIEADPDAADLTLAQRVAEAHRLVLARRGIVAQAAAPAPAPAPAPGQQRREVPVTLSGLPNAGQQTAQDDVLAELNNLNGEDYEMRLASLPAAQVERLLRQTDRAAATVV